MKKKILKNAIVGAPMGIAVCVLFLLLSSWLRGDGQFHIGYYLIRIYGSELNALTAAFLGAMVLGMVWASASLIFGQTDWNLLRQTVLHAALCMVPSMAIAYAMGWMPHNWDGVGQYLRLFGALYALNWLFQYLHLRKNVQQMNAKLMQLGSENTPGENVPDRRFSHRRFLLVTAAAALALLLMGCTIAVAYAQGWFPAFFSAQSSTPLSDSQIAYIEENEQIISKAAETSGWNIELQSTLNDGTVGYILFHVTAPEGTSLQREQKDGRIVSSVHPGDSTLTWSEGVFLNQYSHSWQEDSDGLSNTQNFVVQLYPDLQKCTLDPFGPEAVYHVGIENIILEYGDEETHSDILAEVTWEFDVSFSDDQQLELLTEPITTLATISRPAGEGSEEYIYTEEEITLTSVILKPLTVTLYYADCDGTPGFWTPITGGNKQLYNIHAVMKDGSKVDLWAIGAAGDGFITLEADVPLIPSEVDHILLFDGVQIPVP